MGVISVAGTVQCGQAELQVWRVLWAPIRPVWALLASLQAPQSSGSRSRWEGLAGSSQGAGSLLSAKKDQRLGLKKISVHERMTGVKKPAWRAEGLVPDWWLDGGLAKQPPSGAAREANHEPSSWVLHDRGQVAELLLSCLTWLLRGFMGQMMQSR